MELLRRSKPVARKDHKCDFCYDVIHKGEQYQFQTNVFDGAIYNWKSHLRCEEIAAQLKMYDDCDEGLTGEDFREIITESYYQLRSEDDPTPLPLFNARLDYVWNYHLNKPDA